MACEVIDIKDTILKELIDKHGQSKGLDLYLQQMVDKERTTSKISQLWSNQRKESKTTTSNKLTLIQNSFKDLNIPIEYNSNMDEKARVVYEKGKAVRIELHPDKITSDTIIHEFGHIYIDLLGGTSNPLIRSAINQLKGTDLWRDVMNNYFSESEYTEDELQKEVLAHAIGLYGSELFDNLGKISDSQRNGILDTLRKIWNKIKELFNKFDVVVDIEEDNLAKMLANEILTNQVRDYDENQSTSVDKILKSKDNPVATDLESNKYNVKTAWADEANYIEANHYLVNDKETPRTGELAEGISTKSIEEKKFWESRADKIWKRADKEKTEQLPVGKQLGTQYQMETYQEFIDHRKEWNEMTKSHGTLGHIQVQESVAVLTKDNKTALEKNSYRQAYAKVKGLDHRLYEWLNNDYGGTSTVIEKAFINAGCDILKEKAQFETKIYSPILNYAGTIDCLVWHDDGTCTVIDYKTGGGFNRPITADLEEDMYVTLMSYAPINGLNIMNTPRDKAKLQIALYMVMLKENYPDLKIRAGKVMLISSETMATSYDSRNTVEPEYITLIERALSDPNFITLLNSNKTDNKVANNVVEQLKTKSPRIFALNQYTNEPIIQSSFKTLYQYTKQTSEGNVVKDHDKEKAITEYMLKIEATQRKIAIQQKKKRGVHELGDPTEESFAGEEADRLIHSYQQYQTVLVKELLEITGGNRKLQLKPEDAMGTYEALLASWQELTNPYLKTIQELKTKRLNEARINEDRIMQRFQRAEEAGHKQYMKEKGIVGNRVLQRMSYGVGAERIAKGEKAGIYDRFIIKRATPHDPNHIVEMLITRAEGEEKFRNKEFTSVDLEWLNAAHELSEYYFVNKGSETAYMNTIMQVIDHNGDLEDYTDVNKDTGKKGKMSVLDTYNKQHDHSSFKYYEGWFPKVFMTHEEIQEKAGEGSYLKGMFTQMLGVAIAKEGTDMYNASRSYYCDKSQWYVENSYEQWNNLGITLPIKYIGNAQLDARGEYSRNLGLAFTMFTRAMEQKKSYDGLYAASKAVADVLENYFEKGDAAFKKDADFLRAKIDHEFTGKIKHNKNHTLKLTRTVKDPVTGIEMQAVIPIAIDKILLSLMGWTSKSILAFKPVTGAGNAIRSILWTYKESLRGKVMEGKGIPGWVGKVTVGGFAGINGDEINYTQSDLHAGFIDYIKLSAQTLVGDGKFRQNKLWLLAHQMAYMPDDYNTFPPREKIINLHNRYLNNENLAMLFQSAPDEAISFITLAAQLHHMKHTVDKYTDEDVKKSKNKKVGDFKNVFDCYDVVDGQLKWVAAKRGVKEKDIVTSTGTVKVSEDLLGLDAMEIQKLKFVHKQLQGGYRNDERGIFATSVWGVMLEQLKKYLPRLLYDSFQSVRKQEELGGYRVKDDMVNMEKKPGEQVMEWHGRVVEGRFIIMSKMFAYIVTKGMTLGKGGAYKDEISKWSNEQKSSFIDALITWTLWGVAMLGARLMFKDTPDDDKWKKFYKTYLVDQPTQIYSVVEMVRIAKSAWLPVSIKRASDFVTAIGSLMYDVSMGKGALTKDGRIRNLKQLLYLFPNLGAAVQFMDDSGINENVLGAPITRMK